jgi:glycerol-3-phosphate dehydrogenase (NAD+)
MSKRVAVIGSGSWGTVVAKIIAENIKGNSAFHSVVDMWTFEETLKDGRLLSEVINAEHVNVKYMPGMSYVIGCFVLLVHIVF